MLDYLGGNPFAEPGEVGFSANSFKLKFSTQDNSFGDEDYYMNPEMQAILANYADIIYSDGKNLRIRHVQNGSFR